jgi:hypothetical protein
MTSTSHWLTDWAMRHRHEVSIPALAQMPMSLTLSVHME